MSVPDQPDYHIVGYSIEPSRTLTRIQQEDLNSDLASLLASLAYQPPGVESIAFDLRYITRPDTSIAGRHLLVVVLVRLTLAAEVTDWHRVIDTYRQEFFELLSLHLDRFDYRTRPLPDEDCWGHVDPFEVRDLVDITRRVTERKGFSFTRFQGDSPMSRVVDMLLRQPGSCCLSILLEPYHVSDDVASELELFGYDADFVLSYEDQEAAQLSGLPEGELPYGAPFRAAIRIASDQPISQYLINLVGSELSGRGAYAYSRPQDPTALKEALNALRELRFHVSLAEQHAEKLPTSLRDLLYVFTANEALSVFRLPSERIATSRERLFKTYFAPVANLPANGLLIGTAEHPSHTGSIDVFLSDSDRGRHTYIVGKTGTGKSMLLLNMISQDLEAGRGLCLIDPHGDLVEAVLPRIPEARRDDVYLFDPSDPERVAGLNFLEATSGDPETEKDFLVQEVISMIIRMVDYNVEMFGPRGQQMTRMACLALMNIPEGGTLVEIPRMFNDRDFRRSVMARLTDPTVRHWWETEWEGVSDYHRSEVLSWQTSKFTQFISAPSVRRVVGQAESSFDFQRLMNEGKILLVNLSRGRLGSLNSALLGTMVVSKLLWSAVRRAWEPEAQRREFFLYVDEFQNFVTDSFETILSEARKYKLSLIVAHQHLAQLAAMGRLGDRVERAIFGNIGTSVVFRVGTDAGTLAHELGDPVDGETLRNLQNRFAVAQLLVDDAPTTPFTMRTIDYVSPDTDAVSVGEKTRKGARLRNRTVAEIDQEIASRGNAPE